MPRELMNEFEADCVMRCVHRAGRSARITADVVERSLFVLARSRRLLRGSVGGGTARALEMNREAELHRLAVADEHIATAERAVSKQIVELEKIRGDGHDTELAVKTLQGFEKALDAMRKHREQILKTIAQIDAGLI